MGVFSAIRGISRNSIIRKTIPYFIQVKLWDIVLKSKGEKLRKEIINYYSEKTIHSTLANDPVLHFLKTHKNGFYSHDFLKLYLRQNGTGEYVLDFNGAILPDITNDEGQMNSLEQIFQDTFLFSCFLGDNYSKEIVELFDPCMMEGPYGYTDGTFDVTVKKGDIVIDVGAWIGDFSAYASSKGAITYAFEPVSKNYEFLEKTSALNAGEIKPVQMGLGNKKDKFEVYINEADTAGSGMYFTRSKIKETINVTTLDSYVEENKIEKIDFVKSDIEGEERNLLRGAKNVLKTFAPKLAICTYHSPEDPQLLESIIKEANPDYTVKHTNQKLFAMVI